MDLIPGQVTKGFPVSYSSKESAGQDTRDVGLILGLGRSPTVGNGKLLQYSCLENPMDRGARRATLQGAAESWTQLNGRPGKGREWRFRKPGKKKKESCFSSLVPATCVSLVSFLLPKPSGFYSQSPDLPTLPSLQLFSRSWKWPSLSSLLKPSQPPILNSLSKSSFLFSSPTTLLWFRNPSLFPLYMQWPPYKAPGYVCVCVCVCVSLAVLGLIWGMQDHYLWQWEPLTVACGI